jgi:glycosyltransferase involved in cell wall biosynthesis
MTAQHAFDVIAVEDNAMGAYRYPPGVAAVMTEHEVRRPRRLAVPRGGKGWPRALVDELDWQRWLRYQRVTWGRFALVQTFTNRDATALQSVAPELAGRVRVTPFGLDVPERLPHARSSGMLTFVGNFTHAPNVDAALWLGRDVMPKLRELGPAARLRIVGPCAPPAVAALAAQDIEVLGEVHDLASIMAETAVVLAPVRIGGGMRVKVVEALSLGKAVVTTPRGAEGLRLGAPVLIGRDAGELAAHARALLVDTERRAALEQEAHDYAVAHHSPRAYASRLEDVYEEAVGRAAIPAAAAR